MPAVAAPALTFRPAVDADEPVLLALFVAARPALALLDGPGAEHLLALQRRAQVQAYRARWPEASTEVGCDGAEVVAMVTTAEAGGVRHVLDIAVAPEARGRGIGGAVLSRVIGSGRAPVELTVAVGNPALRLYERLGFVEVARTDTDIALRRPSSAGRAR